MAITYPPVAPTVAGDFITISRFLADPTLVARRLQTLLDNRFIADRLLTGRYQVNGGAIQIETGESLWADDNVRAIAPGAEYPLTTVGKGTATVVKTVKWGSDSEITDESVKRHNMDPVNRTLTKMTNSLVKYIDSVALGAIATSVTATQAASAGWVGAATAEQILRDVAIAKANIVALNQGYDPDIVVVDDLTYASVWSKFAASAIFVGEPGGASFATGGGFPQIAGLTWLPSPNLNQPSPGTALILDSSALGGMADENLGGPGYVNAGGVGIQVKTMRLDETDAWRVRCRRVTVPVVIEPASARVITGVTA